MINIHVDERRFKSKIKKLQGKATKSAPLMRAIVGDMLDAVEENFEQQGRPRWRPLKPQTITQRIKANKWPGRILQRSGKLAASISGRHLARVAIVGTNVKYAKTQQEGNKKRNIPARPYLKLTPNDIKAIERKIHKYLT
jgi:phage virion morphogenesis protein